MHVATTVRLAAYRLTCCADSSYRAHQHLYSAQTHVYLTSVVFLSHLHSTTAVRGCIYLVVVLQGLGFMLVQKKACRIILGPAYTSYDHALTTRSLSRLSTIHRETLVKLGRGLLRHSRLRHLLPPDAPPCPHHTSQQCGHAHKGPSN
ncbi:hypothetical protein E2C01_064162 [Portunus trituberculatus]|uniref:Uncharacterized protein n=1 Tax=Portunus trituberculatus TaxID=210409 RepID=A0A5B7HJL8_PORTR|nr:hypothetical protein [Portunus trituberculatus]